MEQFVKAKNSDESKLSGSLKASGGGAFKHQKSNRPQVQWERAKSLILSEENEWNIIPNSQRQYQGGIGDNTRNSRPPDLNFRPPNLNNLPQNLSNIRRQKVQSAAKEDQMERSLEKGIASNMEC